MSARITEPSERRNVRHVTSRLAAHAVDEYVIDRYGRRIIWYRLDIRETISVVSESLKAAELLEQILASIFDRSDMARGRAVNVLSGHVGAANSMSTSRDAESILAAFNWQFSRMHVRKDANISQILTHPLFDDFLNLKAQELAKGLGVRQGRRRR